MENKKIKTLLVLTGFTCNNNCLVCSVGEKRCAFPDRSFAQIKKDLRAGRLSDYEEIEFTGGEPTIRKDIAKLIKCAHDFGYKRISMSTNGRLFSYEDFTEKLVQAGLNRVTFSLLGASGKVHNATTRTLGSFSEIIEGINNVKKYKKVEIKVSTVVSRFNYKDLKKIARLVISLKIKHWYLLDLIPGGNAKESYINLVVDYKEQKKKIGELKKFAGKFTELGFFDFPFCVFEKEMKSFKNIIFINAKKRGETAEQIGYNPERIILNKQGSYIDRQKKHVKICRNCRYYNECGGSWEEYFKLFGEKEIEKLAKENKCLN